MIKRFIVSALTGALLLPTACFAAGNIIQVCPVPTKEGKEQPVSEAG